MADVTESSQNIEGSVVVSNLIGGTITKLGGGTVVVGGGTTNVTTGSIVQTAGTLTTGTLQNLVSGTVNVGLGTITAGTFRQNWRPTNIGSTFGTLGTANGSLFGTLAAASGAGTVRVISGCSIVVESGTADIRVLIGTAITGASVLAAGKFVPSAGITRDFNPPIETAANSELCYHFVGA